MKVRLLSSLAGRRGCGMYAVLNAIRHVQDWMTLWPQPQGMLFLSGAKGTKRAMHRGCLAAFL